MHNHHIPKVFSVLVYNVTERRRPVLMLGLISHFRLISFAVWLNNHLDADHIKAYHAEITLSELTCAVFKKTERKSTKTATLHSLN